MRLAFSTITVLRQPWGHPEVREYQEMIGPVFTDAQGSPGFIARAMPVDDKNHLTNFERDWGSWGEFTTPRFYTGGRVTATDTRASTLSIWEDLASVRRFMHSSNHIYMVRNKQRWVTEFEWKNYAAWWVGDEEIPTWQDAADRIEHINDHGPSPYAFDFSRPYDEHGQPVQPPAPVASGGREGAEDAD